MRILALLIVSIVSLNAQTTININLPAAPAPKVAQWQIDTVDLTKVTVTSGTYKMTLSQTPIVGSIMLVLVTSNQFGKNFIDVIQYEQQTNVANAKILQLNNITSDQTIVKVVYRY